MDEYGMHLANYKIVSMSSDVYILPQGVDLIGAAHMWEQGEKGSGITVAVIDTGCDINHIEFKDRIVGGCNFTDEDEGKMDRYLDYNGHGTHVCGIIAASMNGTGVVGVAPEASLLILKALNKEGLAKYSWIINAIRYAVRKKVDIISMSLGGAYDDVQLHNAIKEAVQKNILVVCAVANETEIHKISYPAYYDECIAVGSTDYKKPLEQQNYFDNKIDLVAPGVEILSTYLNGSYAEMSGTSMAVPHVTGALALLINWCKKEFGRKLSEPELYAQLIKRTINFGYTSNEVGNGYIFLTAMDLLKECYDKKKVDLSCAKMN